MRINTRIVLDIGSGGVLERDSYEYTGPVAEAKGKGGTPGQTTSAYAPPAYAMPYITQQLKDVNNAFSPYISNPESSVAPMSADTQAGIGALREAAGPGSVGANAQGEINKTLNGDYLFGGPGFNAAYTAAANKIIPQVQSAFGMHGRLNGGLAQAATAGALGDAFAGLYGQERGNQMQALSLAPGIAGLRYAPLLQAGGLQDMYQQRLLDAPFNVLQQKESLLTPFLGNGSQTTTQTSPQAGRLQQALGGAATGFALGGAIPAAIGGGAGLLGLL